MKCIYMTVLVRHELARLNISNKCNLIYTDTISNLPMIGKNAGVIIPKTRVNEIPPLKVPAYIFISEKLPENAILICGQK